MSSTKVVVSAVAIVAITFHFASEEKLGKKKKTKKKTNKNRELHGLRFKRKENLPKKTSLEKNCLLYSKRFFF